MRPGRQLAVLSGLLVLLYVMVMFVGTSGMGWAERFAPRLGLDLVGGQRLTLEAQPLPNGQPPNAKQMAEARDIIHQRVDARGVAEAEIVVEGDRNIVISRAGKGQNLGADIGEAAQLRFRKVLNVTDGNDTSATPVPTPSASASATPKPATTPPARPQATSSPGAAAPAPAAPGTASPAPAAPSAAAARPGQKPMPELLADAKRKVGPAAWAAAEALKTPDTGKNAALKPFASLTEEEVSALPFMIQFNVPQVTCEKLDKRRQGSISGENVRAVACEGSQKYLLDIAKVLGGDVATASPQVAQTGQRVVSLEFTDEGADKWSKLTSEAYNNSGPEETKCPQQVLGNDGHCLVAVVLDNKIISAPEIQGVLGEQSQIDGNFTAESAGELASQLRYGALPVTFEVPDAQTISASLGSEHLKAGLLAAGIGMLLVIIYSFFYYRLLGGVIFLSLVLSGLLIFGALVVLGREIQFTLTLAGIAGFIVSLGVAADSFVIYFERLKDEIRDGRSPRSAVPRAWARARRTIISANAITIMAAVVLYLVSVGTVKGFAFALGLATVLDLVVVFLFRHPIMTMFARTKAFLSPRVSGLGRVLQRDDAVKEA
ncbi:protein translocase subunit SecD [Pilimelia terevasa]|nr:protein translocase subunit SecD [Pilimelia terevasa]